MRFIVQTHTSKLSFFYRVSDVLLIFLTLYFSTLFLRKPWLTDYSTAGFIAVGSFVFFSEFFQNYHLPRGIHLRQMIPPIVGAWCMSILTLIFVIYGTSSSHKFSRLVISLWAILVPLCIVLWHILVQRILGYIRSKGFNSRRVVIAGANKQAADLYDIIKATPSLGLNLVGIFDDREKSGRIKDMQQYPIQGNLAELIKLAHDNTIDLVYITLPLKAENRISDIIKGLLDTTVSIHYVPNFLAFDLLNSRWIYLGSVPAISIRETPLYGVDGWFKRVEDILVSSVALILLSIPMLVIAVGVKFSSPGPALFKQRRYGFGGHEICVWKFRTMRVCEDDNNLEQATKNDYRVTPFGAFLRRNSLDELPQFINVFVGNMSIVGPRPHAVIHNEKYRKLIPGYMLRHKIKPGITGWAQVNGWRGETETLDKMQMRVDHDLYYLRNWSLLLDIEIIFRTLFSSSTHSNAY